jgi:hypothetical protein
MYMYIFKVSFNVTDINVTTDECRLETHNWNSNLGLVIHGEFKNDTISWRQESLI